MSYPRLPLPALALLAVAGSIATATPTPTATASPIAISTATPGSSSFVVNSTGDGADVDLADGRCDDGSGTCTLRAAIEQANAQPDWSSILFNIPGDGIHTIRPSSPLPAITTNVSIDGYSQPGAAPDTDPSDLVSDAVLKIELDGSSAGGDANGLYVVDAESPKGPPTCRIAFSLRGLVINRFSANGIRLERVCQGDGIQGNYIGTDPSGEIDLGNQGSGILQIDTVEDGVVSNVISGNEGYAISAERGGGDWGIGFNLIGTNAAGTSAIGNNSGGIFLRQVGDVSIDRNVISGNHGPGVTIDESSDMSVNRSFIGTERDGATPLGNGGDGVEIIGESAGVFIRMNSIDSNGGLGIDLGGDGVTGNDRLDEDSGPNELQNFPEITSVTSGPSGITIRGRLRTALDTPGPLYAYDLNFYASPACDGSGFGEGQTFLGSISVVPDHRGEARFKARLPVEVPRGHVVTATASRVYVGTSEFSRCRIVP